MWCIIVVFLLGFVSGSGLVYILNRGRDVDGRLIIDMTNPYNDQPFLLELMTNVNDVYNKDQVLLDVSHK